MIALVAMALADLRAQWAVALALVCATVAVGAPLLVMLGLQAGVLGQVFGGLRADPAIRAVTLDATGQARLDDAWFADVRGWPEVGFVHPATRFAAAQVAFLAPGGGPDQVAALVPTAPGDPVFPGAAAPGPFEVRLSADLAARLGVAPGQPVRVAFERETEGRIEPLVIDLTVTAIAEAAAYRGRAGFVAFDLLLAIEDYRDRAGAPLLGVAGPPAAPRAYYPTFRLYAADLDAVAPLVARLGAQGLSVSAQTDRIAGAQALARSLGAVTAALGLMGALGLGGGIAAIQWSLALQRRRVVATLALIGFGAAWLIGFGLVQALVLAGLGALGTSLAALGFCGWINANLAGAGGACALGWGLHAAMAGAIAVLSLVPALVIGWRMSGREIGDDLRDP